MATTEQIERTLSTILPVLRRLDIDPILWGSLAYRVHSGDADTPVNDIDLLIPFDAYPRVRAYLEQHHVSYIYEEGWDCIRIESDGIIIELDPLERYPAGNSEPITIGSQSVHTISLESLIDTYLRAVKDPKVAAYDASKIPRYQRKYEQLRQVQEQKAAREP